MPVRAVRADTLPVRSPHRQVRIAVVLCERFEMFERSPVLDHRESRRLVAEQALLGVFREVLEHVSHAAATAEIGERAERLPLRVEPGADQEHDEVAIDPRCPSTRLDVCRHANLPHAFRAALLLARPPQERTATAVGGSPICASPPDDEWLAERR